MVNAVDIVIVGGGLNGAALALLDLAPPLKNLFARKMMFGAQAW